MPVRRYRVRGRVQGVGFRWWARTEAERLQITGSVRNDSDGSVVVVAEGDEAALRSFRDRLGKGPPSAEVEGVEESSGGGEGFTAFSIIP